MAVDCSSKEGLPLGFSLHLRAEEAIAKFQREIEDDFNYLHEILAEAKRHFGRRDSNILLPKTPSMKRKRHESDEEQSSDDTASKTAREAKAPKTQGCASPLMVINEDELLDCSVANEAGKQEEAKRKTRATTKGNAQPKRQQPKRGSRKKNVPDVESSVADQSSGSSMDEKPKRNTRNSRKKNVELVSLIEEKETGSSSANEKDLPKRATRNARKKHLEETVEVSSAEELPAQPATKKRKSSTATKLKDSGEITASVVVKQEPASPHDEVPTRRSTRNSRKEEELAVSGEKQNENEACVPETPEAVVEKVVSPQASAKTCKATINVILQSPGFNIPKATREAPVATSSPCIEQDLGPHEVTVEENNACPEEQTNNDVVTVNSPTPIVPQECAENCTEVLSEDKEELENKEVENVANNETDVDAVDGNVGASKEGVEKEHAEEADTRVKSGRRSTQRNSGWRRKSKRSSRCLSPVNKRLSVNRTVTKTKEPGKKSIVKSSVKLKLTQSKLMPELKIGSADKSSNNQSLDANLDDVRVRLFDNLTSESSACSVSPTTSKGSSSSSCGSAEDKAEAPVEMISEEPAEDDGEEVFHDCRESEDEADDEADNAKCTEANSKQSPTVEDASSPMAAVRTSKGSTGSEESVAISGEVSEEPTTPPPQEAVNPSQKARPNNIALVHSFIRRNTPKKVDPEEKKKQLRIALKEKEEKEKERREQLEMQRQREIEERKRRREERVKKAAEQRAARFQALEEKKRQAEDQRHIMEEKAKKLKEKEEEDKKKQRKQKRAEVEARKKQEEAARLQKKREQEEEEKRQREMLQKKQELEEQERQRKIAEAKRLQEHREKELERERELEKQRKLKAIEEKEKRLREKEEKERKSREEKQRIERERKAQEDKEREERERARIAQLIREKEEHARREREQRAREDKERQDRERRLKEEREAALREKKRQEQMEKERQRVLEERKLAEENKKVESTTTCDSYEMTPPPVKIRKPASQENYNIADLHSDDSTDDEDNPRKKIPSWARPAALKAAIFHQEYSNIDVNSIFDSVPAPDLEAIFTKCQKKKRFHQRTSSAIWDSPPLRQQVKRGTYV
ncbi:hypothetical protein ACROYT_G006387 [Oculina patagonica]